MSNPLWIKICGLTTPEAIEATVRAQADAIGFVFAPSKRQVTAQRAVELSRDVPRSIARVAVMQHPTQAQLDEVLQVFQPTILQIDIEDLSALQVPQTLRIHPVIRAGRQAPDQLPARFLFEGPVSGTGRTADWTTASKLARRSELILAGGLNPENVSEAVRLVNPFGVDVSSGVESAPGIKDPTLVMRFVSAARESQDVLVV
ncbi:MAG TPA: phosphoribosylanthranilate isomerase [Steroidobacteraceae bacterium]|nr:phosphoribosylanthranilate isomerase [Steroidobacteraceae bacterium]